MQKVERENAIVFQSKLLSKFNDVDHFFSSKQLGFDQVNKLAKAINSSPIHTIIPQQTHSDNIVVVSNENFHKTHYDTDALITNEKGMLITIKTADCVPILLFDPIENAIAAIHAGWRGTSKNITGKTVRQLVHNYGCKPENIIACIGPCIGKNNYEVGNEVINQFNLLQIEKSQIISVVGSAKKTKLDLRKTNMLLLLNEGLKLENIEVSDYCTYEQRDYFYSARRDGAQTGRMLNCIVLK